MNKKKLLLFVDWFFPGYKAGGPIQSCKNIVEILQDKFDIYIFTSDRDIGDKNPYLDITTNQWIPFGVNNKIFYASPSFCSITNIKNVILAIQPNTVYLNSMFSYSFALKPLYALRSFKKEDIKIVLAPRGMLHQGAIKIKKIKKTVFLKMLKNTGLTNKTIFHATDEQEVKDIKKYFKSINSIVLIKNIPHINTNALFFTKKKKGEVNFIFISRLHRKKNILFFIELLSFITNHKINLDIYGYVDDELYKDKCRKAIEKLPQNISVSIKEAIANDSIFTTISLHHIFVLPTLGENFGHAIFEALSSGRPVLLSDQTPWRDLSAKKIGWDISLNQPKEFIEIIEQVANWTQTEFDGWCSNAYNFAQNFIDLPVLKQDYINLFS